MVRPPAIPLRDPSFAGPAAVRPSRWWFAVALAVLAIHLTSARWHVLHGSLNADEGFYAIGTRAVAQGEMPYRDFGFPQPPLVLYANALPLQAAGFGLFAQRAVNGLWTALALGLAAAWLARRTHPAWALGLVLLFSLSAPWMYFNHLGKTYGVTTLLALVAARVFLALPAGPRRNFLLGLLAAAGAATRLPAIPFFGALGALALWPGRRPTGREALAAAGGAVCGSVVFILPFWLAAPEAGRFWVFDLHRLSLLERPWQLSWREVAVLSPAAWLLAALALIVATLRHRLFTRETGVLLAAGATLAANLLPSGVYEEYAVPFLLPLAVAAAALLYRELPSRQPALLLVVGVALLLAQALTAPLLCGRLQPERRGTASQWLSPRMPPYNPALPDQLALARQIVETELLPGAPFIGTNLILAAETGRAVPSELRMGPFSWTQEIPPARAARLHLATRPQLDAWFARPDVTVLSFFQRWDLNYGWSMPSFRHEPPAVREHTIARLERDFLLAYNTPDFFLLVRRPVPTPFSRQLRIPTISSP